MQIVDPTTSQEILSARKVRFDLDVWELFNRICMLENITVDSPKINLLRDANGAWNVEKLVKSVRSGKKKTSSSKQVSWLKFGTIRVYNCSISIHDALVDKQLSVNNLGATVDVVSKKATVHPATLLLGESHYQIQVEVTDFTTPRIVGKLSADVLNIDEIVSLFTRSKTSAEQSTSPKSSTQPGFSAEVVVKADSMRFGKLKTGAVSTIWRTSDRKQEFSPFHLDAFGGELEGVFDLTILENGTSWHINFTGKELALELVCDQFLEEGTIKDEAKGLLSAKGTLRGVASRKREAAWRSLGGEFTFEAIDGVIKKSPFNNIILIMQLPVDVLFVPEETLVDKILETAKTKGHNLVDTRVTFKKVDGTFHIADGVAHTKDSHFAGKTFDLLWEGDIDLAEKQIDMHIRAVPIGPVGLVLPKVPVVGKELEKAEKSAFSLMFSARGPLAKPELHLSPMDKLKPKEKQ
jgi:hypothetical protein